MTPSVVSLMNGELQAASTQQNAEESMEISNMSEFVACDGLNVL